MRDIALRLLSRRATPSDATITRGAIRKTVVPSVSLEDSYFTGVVARCENRVGNGHTISLRVSGLKIRHRQT